MVRAMRSMLSLSILLGVCLASATALSPSRTVTKRDNPGFITTSNGRFTLNGSDFDFVGTNAYWLPTLNTDKDINDTLLSIKAAGIKVVRTWAFNDVTTIPTNGTWFQSFINGTFNINNGTNGLQRLDKVVELAEQAGMHVLLSLTNNWNPLPLIDNVTSFNGSLETLERRDVTLGTNNSLPRNFLSNDYGGMDFYVRAFGNRTHDEFYTNETIKAAFMNYTNQVVSRYVNSPAIFSWELANDPRCNSSVPASDTCVTQNITIWHSDLANFVRSIDPNHLVSSGSHGFQCLDCAKLFTPTPKPQPSPAPGRKRSVRPMTTERFLRERAEARKRTRAALKRDTKATTGGVRIRGRWVAAEATRRDDTGVGSSMDGSQGVDSQDILNIPDIGFGTFQLFPDQNTYEPPDPSLPAFNNTVQAGIQWILSQAALAQSSNKPTALTAFGLVTQNNAPFFVPFNTTIAPFNGTNSTASTSSSTNDTTSSSLGGTSFGVTDSQQADAYTQWITTAANAGVSGVTQYQWGQTNLTTSPGTTISPNTDSSTTTTNQDTSGITPNDGYGIAQVGNDTVAPLLTDLSPLFGSGS